MRGKFGLHHMAALPAELRRVHVLHRAIAELASDNHVRDASSRRRKSPRAETPLLRSGRVSIVAPIRRLARYTPIGISARPAKKTTGIDDEQQQSDIRILDRAAQIRRQQKQPRESRRA